MEWLNILKNGIVPISAAAAQLAKLIKRAQEHPIILTQKGRPTGVILSIDEYVTLRNTALAVMEEQIAAEEELMTCLSCGGSGCDNCENGLA